MQLINGDFHERQTVIPTTHTATSNTPSIVFQSLKTGQLIYI